MLFWHVPAPDEALLISGSKSRTDELQFRIITGHGCFVWPVKQRARTLSLALRESEIVEDCVTNQGIRLTVQAVAAFKIGDDPVSIANAARRFLTEQDRLEELVGRIFAGHLRSIVGALTVEQIIRDRDEVAQEVKDASHSEMEKLGIVADALQIQEIVDATGYISHLAAPHAAAVASQARIAAARADREANEAEQQAAALTAQYERDAAVKMAAFAAETERARAHAAQAGPLARAQATQEVIEQQTALAEREAELAARRLDAEVRRPADAEAYRQRTLAEADAAANELRAASLRGGNQEVIAAGRLVEMLPQLVESAAHGLSGANLTVLNGATGVSELLTGVVGQGMAILDLLRSTPGATSVGSAASVGSVPPIGAAASGSAGALDSRAEQAALA